jgi:CubicO group peptidase (beta-lactamase class C family)
MTNVRAAVAAGVLSVCATLPCMARPVPGQDRSDSFAGVFSRADTLVSEFASRQRIPGVAYGIVIDGTLIHQATVGVRDVSSGAPVDGDTVFRIASMTKSFTALAILKLRDEGRLRLDDPVEQYIPEFSRLAYPTTDAPRITIRHLLSHAEGFPEDNPWGDRQLARTEAEFTDLLRRGIPFSTTPGTAYEYSNFGFAILGRIVATVSGKPYRTYVQEAILDPLGLSATTLDSSSVPPARLAHGYRIEDGAWLEEPLLPDGAFGPMGGMMTSLHDLATYVGFLMSAWPPRDGPDPGPVRRSTVREMQQVWRPASASVTRDAVSGAVRLNAGGYGFGLRVWQTCDVAHVVAHSGGLPGFGSHMRWLPDRGVAIIALGNLTYTSWGRVADDIMAMLVAARPPRPAVPSSALLAARDEVSRLVGAWDDALANRIAAGNLFLDESRDRRRAALAAVRAETGACQLMPGRFEAENALRGSWLMACERGWLSVSVTLAPTMPPLVQSLDVTRLDHLPPLRDATGGVCR